MAHLIPAEGVFDTWRSLIMDGERRHRSRDVQWLSTWKEGVLRLSDSCLCDQRSRYWAAGTKVIKLRDQHW